MKGNYRTLIISWLVLLPIFISFGSGIGLDRVGGYSSLYFLTLPLAIFIISFLLVSSIKKLVKEKFLIVFLLYLAVCILGSMFYNELLLVSVLKTTFLMGAFISSIYAFQYYFDKNIEYIDKKENLYILYPFIFLLILVVISYFLFGRYSFLSETIKIYNYEQYFAFSLILMLGVISKIRFIYFMFLSSMIVFIIINSVNITALILFYFFILMYSLFKFTPVRYHKIIYQISTLIFVMVSLLFPFFLYEFYDIFGTASSSIVKRYDMVNAYFSNINFFQVLFPFLHNSRGFVSDMHNEVLEIFNATGVGGLFLYYYFIIQRLRVVAIEYKYVATSIVLVIFLGGMMVENTLHLYMLIILSYVTSFYYVASKYKNKENLI